MEAGARTCRRGTRNLMKSYRTARKLTWTSRMLLRFLILRRSWFLLTMPLITLLLISGKRAFSLGWCVDFLLVGNDLLQVNDYIIGQCQSHISSSVCWCIHDELCFHGSWWSMSIGWLLSPHLFIDKLSVYTMIWDSLCSNEKIMLQGSFVYNNAEALHLCKPQWKCSRQFLSWFLLLSILEVFC